MTILQQVEVVVPVILGHIFGQYEAHIKGLPICFREVHVKNDFTDNNNKHFVTAFEGACRNIIELREHLKLCFLVILACAASSAEARGVIMARPSPTYFAANTLMPRKVCLRLSVRISSRLTIISHEINITFCFKSTFCRQIFSC